MKNIDFDNYLSITGGNITGSLSVSNKISGDLTGTADKAVSDSLGQKISDTYATKKELKSEISNLVNSAPETLDTLQELADALGNDPNFATTVANQIGTKADDSKVVHNSGNETISGVKTFSSTITGSISGNAATATKLTTARTIRTNLASTSTSSFNGTANITPGVTGVLPVANGGTGSSTEKYLQLTGGTLSGKVIINNTLSVDNIYKDDLTSSFTMGVGSGWDTGSSLSLYGDDNDHPARFALRAGSGENGGISLIGINNSSLTWNGKNIVRSVNGVNADVNGNVTTVSMPIGSIYIQFSGQSDPTSLFGGTWQNVSSSYAGRFFRAEGGSAAAFGSSQSGGLPNITGRVRYGSFSTQGVNMINIGVDISEGSFYAGTAASGNYANAVAQQASFHPDTYFNASRSSSLYGAATEVRPINSTIRIWKRTG